ncbi:maleylpyruvate isomerase family mycothiol-dependent enzyme [Kineosporia sp. R_H_3]|uniref:maleylpyruvate isomerase family mycothiol-dependent enzyme n=1 Tax=Kineosporia sp. R_H_3 TaxID=1961848 RepID=UPI000B4C20A8|nr:maleylpyruvate isomerase family mycothiol-dependent enzyme [Kineosporia sp. R_H_3]
MADVWDLIAVERLRAADLVGSLDDDQLAVQSLCGAWRVRDVAGHLTMPFSVGVPALLVGAVRSGGLDRFSEKVSRELGGRGAQELAATLRRHARTRFQPPGTGPWAPLTDLVVHVRDIARPLGLPVSASDDAWRGALAFLVSGRARLGFVPRGRLRGLRLAVPGLGWSHGDGPEVSGPAEAVALAVAGRAVALDDLTGEGVPLLRQRVG